jgi:chorismate mutase/prephenate dehydratase
MELQECREKIDIIDKQLVKLFQERMDIAAAIAEYKKENNLPITDTGRERSKLSDIEKQTKNEYLTYMDALYSMIFELSRSHQRKLTGEKNDLADKISKAISETDKLFPERALVACQGTEGAYSQQACEKMFSSPDIMYFNSFEGVFSAIDNGLCRYGILPLENSTAGSVNKIYDLMMKYDFSIVKSTRLKIDHSLLVNKGVKFSEIKEIYSHEQAIAQCENFLKNIEGVKIIPCDNTATAAKYVFESGRRDVAALSARSCAELYGLECIRNAVQDQGSNYTRFICISKKLEIYPGADKTSIMLVLRHRPGALYKVLARLFALGININKLESRPLPNSDFEFMFYFDLETSIYSENFPIIFDELSEMCSTFRYLGSYSEAV